MTRKTKWASSVQSSADSHHCREPCGYTSRCNAASAFEHESSSSGREGTDLTVGNNGTGPTSPNFVGLDNDQCQRRQP
jgi:hypothetical protein